MSFVNEIDDVVYILTVLGFSIFIGCYFLFRTLSLSFYYTHYCKILLYYIIYYIVNTQFSLVAASFLQINYLSIYVSIYLSKYLSSINVAGDRLQKLKSTFKHFLNFVVFVWPG